MEEWLKLVAGHVALAVETGAMIVVVIGAVEAFVRLARIRLVRTIGLRDQKDVWLRFAGWLVLGLEFQLAADVVRTAIAPTWDQIGQLAAIATIRTVLNFFLTRDIEGYSASVGARADAGEAD